MENLAQSNFMAPESPNRAGNGCPMPANVQKNEVLSGPVAILWDIENCPVPSDVRPEDVAGNIRMALRAHPVIVGAVTLFSAYGDFNSFPRRLREGCQRTGVKLVDVPNGRKDAADKAILVDMFLFALDNSPPSTILLISGDVDFAPALHILGQRGYTVILVIPGRMDVSSALSSAGQFLWDWPSVARGEGFVLPRLLMSRGVKNPGFSTNCHVGKCLVGQNEEERIVYPGTFHSEYSTQVNINQTRCSTHVSNEPLPSRGFGSTLESGGNNLSGIPFPLKSQTLSSSLQEVVNVEESTMQEEVTWVQPGDIQGLKGQITKLLEISGGSLPLVRVPPEYLKKYGRPLYVTEYGALKLVNLVKKMGSPLSVVGQGQYKVVCIRNFTEREGKAGACTSSLRMKGGKGKEAVEDTIVDICMGRNIGSSSDDFSDDEKMDMVQENVRDVSVFRKLQEYDRHIESFRQEMQELLVCYSCRILLGSFEALYEQRYKKSLNYRLFGVDGLDELIKKVNDVVVLLEEQQSKKKFLVSTFMTR